jgi:chaperonin GroES
MSTPSEYLAQPSVEIELEEDFIGPDGVDVFFNSEGVGSIGFDPEEEPQILFGENIADYLEDRVLSQIASTLIQHYREDLDSREDWYDTFKSGLDLLGIKSDNRSEPFQGASGVYHPLLAEAVTHFQAQAYKELLPAGGPVDTQVMGKMTDPKMDQANRVKNFMNFQLTYKMEEYDPEMDQLLFYLPLAGSAFKKSYYDPALGRAVSRFIKAEDLIVPYSTTDLVTSPRITHVIKMTENDLRKLQLSGFYSDIALSPPSLTHESPTQEKIDEIDGTSSPPQEEEYTLLEVHAELDIEGLEDTNPQGEPTGLALPYIVTICLDSNKVLAIRQNYEETDPMRKKIEHFTHFKFLPGLGFYGFGLIHMIGGVTKSATAILRQLIDAGTLSNLPAGFKSRGLNIQRTDDPIQPGEWRDVDTPGGTIRDSFLPLPYKEPSATLSQLLGLLVESGQRFASVLDTTSSDANQNAPVGSTVAVLEKGQKVISAIHKRLHYAQRTEFKILKRVFGETLPPEYPYQVQGAQQTVFREDFSNQVDVIPISDPNIFSTTQRIILAQTQLQMAQSAPEIHNLKEAFRKMYLALNIRDIDDILIPDAPPAPKDPIQENQDALTKKPLEAFIQQNHDAHIQTHMAFIENPNTEKNQEAVAALQAHIQQHQALKYRIQVEQILAQQGVELPKPGQDGKLPQLPPEAESQIAMAAAQATQQITGQEQALADAMEAPPDEQREMFNEQMNLEYQKLKQKREEAAQKFRLGIEKMESDEKREDLRTAADLQEAEMKHQEQVDKGFLELTKLAELSRRD